MGDWFKVYPWKRPMTQFVSVCQALGFAIVEWPSGRRTLEMSAANVIMTEIEAAALPGITKAKELNLRRSIEEFRERTDRNGWWIRHKGHRRKPRRVVSVEWVHPDGYKGPAPDRWGMLPVDLSDV